MMSLRAVNAGSGYEYLLRSVATNDAANVSAPSLSKYYAAQGTPPGRWLGSGLIGLESKSIHVGEVISDLQMAALYGEGIHPDTDAKTASGLKLDDCLIGRAFPTFTNKEKVLVALRTAEKAFRTTHQRLPSSDERSTMAMTVGTPFFIAEKGCGPVNGKEVVEWVNQKKDRVKQAVAGFDFTFSPAKSISVLWALSDEETASRIAACHHRAVAEAMAWAEDEFIRTRSGAGGIRQVKTRGLIAAEFTHFDTRAGDPDLHSHVLVSNKVQDVEGKWKALDGRTIFRFHQAMSFRYNSLIQDELTRELGVDFEAHDRGPGKQPVWEIVGIPTKVLTLFSRRRAMAEPVYRRKVEAYATRCGGAPNKRISNELWQQAILETRDAKKPAQSLDDLRSGWEEDLLATADGSELLAQIRTIISDEGEPQRPLFVADEHQDQACSQAIELATSRRNVFRRSHVQTAVASILSAWRFESLEHRDRVQEDVVDDVLERYGLHLNGHEPVALPEQLTNETGRGIDVLLDSDVYTTADLLAAEQRVFDAADENTGQKLTDAQIEKELAAHAKREGWSLNEGQQQLARHLLACGTLVATGVGPAGTGKTASMSLVTTAWRNSGRNVVGLAPSAAAATLLADDIQAPAYTIDSLVFTWRGLHPTRAGGTLADLPVTINPGDMLLVDEAGMASTSNLAALVEIAHAAGAVLRFVGDPKQLEAVENGGLFGALTRAKPTAELSRVMRFGDDAEQEEASLRLRSGNTKGLDFYENNQWIHGGTRTEMLTQAATAYLADLAAGRKALVLAATNADVETLNEIIRSHRVDQGLVDDSTTTALSHSERAGVGDIVIARKNALFRQDRNGVDGRVINGDLFEITEITMDGTLTVRHQTTGRIQTLPADYVSSNVHLGYASTVHRAQGATVDVCRAVIDWSVSQAGLYVGLTRGKLSNQAYVVCEHNLDLEAEQGHFHYQGEGPVPTPRSVLDHIVERNEHETAALETMWKELKRANSPERIRGLWYYGRDLATDIFVDTELPDWIASMPKSQRQQLLDSEDGTAPIESAWKALIRHGIDPRLVMDEALSNLDGAIDIERLITWRLRNNLPQAEENDLPEIPFLTPACAAEDPHLRQWLEANIPAPLAPKIAEGGDMSDQDFSGMDFSGMDIKRVKFINCRFDAALLRDTDINDCSFRNCSFVGANLTNSTLTAARFINSTLDRADLSGSTLGQPGRPLSKVLISNCHAHMVKLVDAVINTIDVTRSTMTALDLSGAAVTDGTFQFTDLTDTHTDAGTSIFGTLTASDCTLPDDLPFTRTSAASGRLRRGMHNPAAVINEPTLPPSEITSDSAPEL